MACGHKSNVGCALTALPTCCSCSDRRPLAAAYPVYIDGQGMKMQGKRWSRYCWRCRDHWNREEAEEQLRQRYSGHHSVTQGQSWAFPMTRPVQVRRSRQGRPSNQQGVNPYVSTDVSQSLAVGAEARAQPLDLRGEESAPPTTNPHRRGGPHTWTASPQHRREHSEILVDHGPRPRRSRQPLQNPLIATFGTREEIEAEGYQSPISTMYERWEDRYRTAETRRSQLESGIPDQSGNSLTSPLLRREIPDIANPFQPPDPVEQSNPLQSVSSTPSASQTRNQLPTSALSTEQVFQQASRIANFVAEQASHSHPRLYATSPPRPNPIDIQASRPPALSQAEMTVSIACQICNEQRSDTLLNPCSHLCMCHWCSEIIRADALAARRNRESGAPKTNHWRCPICRKDIAGVTRVYLC